jgi:hypothetical protein
MSPRWRAAWPGVLVPCVALLILPAVGIFGDSLRDLWTYQAWDAHRFTAMSMLEGSLEYHLSLVNLSGDEQVHDGAGYTQWGYGVPLLQLPFHAIARHLASLPNGFFPDRAIVFVYLALAVPLLWAGLDRVLAMRQAPAIPRVRRLVLSWSATAFVLCVALYPVMASRFQVYDETIAYFVMVQLSALTAYVFMLGAPAGRRGWLAVVALAAAAGLGLLVRPTGAIFLCAWAALALLERRASRIVLVFGASVAPFVLFWMFTNFARTGSPLSLGFQNSLPGPEHVGMVRFGSVCVDTMPHAVQTAFSIFQALFLVVTQEPEGWMRDCGLSFELRHHLDHTSVDPFLGPAVLAFLVGTALHFALRRDRRLSLYVPHLAVACLVAMYAWAGAGLAQRYAGDFWPLVVLAGVQFVRTLPAAATPVLGWPLAAVLTVGAIGAYHRDVETGRDLVEDIAPEKIPGMWADFEATRTGRDLMLPSKMSCGDVPEWPRFNVDWRPNVVGWHPDCTVDTFSEVFLGVAPKDGDAYVIRFSTYGIDAPGARIYVNGRTYPAQKSGDLYEANVRIDSRALSSPTVVATIEWRHGVVPPEGSLLEVELE